MSKSKVKILCRMAVLAALYALLTLVSIRAGNLRVTFASLPVAVCAVLFGPWQAAGVAICGEFLNQMLTYGFTVTTVLWLIPPAVRGLCIGYAALACRKTERALEYRPVTYYAVFLLAALVTTVCNTAVIWVDSKLLGYYSFAYVFGDFMLRTFTGVVTAAVIATVSLPLVTLLRRQKLAGNV